MVIEQALEYLKSPHPFWIEAMIVTGVLILISLLVIVIIFPFILKKKQETSIQMHPQKLPIKRITVPTFKRIAIALDFSRDDTRLVAYALSQGTEDSTYVLIHVVESASAKILGNSSADYESMEDENQLEEYTNQLRDMGANAVARLGYRNRTHEIARIVREEKADLLIMGAHGHTGVKDWLYGETINHVRHAIKIPVLVVNL